MNTIDTDRLLGHLPQPAINIVLLTKGDDRYAVLFDDASRAEALQTIGRWAADPELNFTWYDAAQLNHKISTKT